MKTQAIPPVTPPVATEPSARPKIARRMPETKMMTKNSSGNSWPMFFDSPLQCSSGGGSASPSTTPIMRSTPAEIPPAEIAFAEPRRDRLVDDAVADEVGERALEAVTDLDAQRAVLHRDEQQCAVVRLLAAELPGVDDADRVLLDLLGLRRRHDQHRDLRALPRLECSELRLERLALACA